MEKYHLKLTPSEANILSMIDLRSHEFAHDEAHRAYNSNKKPIIDLLRSLTERGAIPSARIKYWDDPEYHYGRVKASRKGLFERNGNKGTEIYEHPNFISYLKYFLFGADLPDTVVESFEKKVGNPEWVSSSDIVPIGEHARMLIRQYDLPHSAPDEFFKLVLDMGLSFNIADSVRRAAAQANRRPRR